MAGTLAAWYAAQGSESDNMKELVAGRRTLTGQSPSGLRWAASGPRRVLAFARGGWSPHRWVDGPGWCLLNDPDEAGGPEWLPLLAALGLE